MAQQRNDISPGAEPAEGPTPVQTSLVETTAVDAGAADAPAAETEAAAPAGNEIGAEEAEIPEAERLRREIEILEGKLLEHRERALRAQAELDNFRKRAARDMENAHRYALERFVGELLPVMDSIELGIDATGSAGDIEGLREGMDLTRRKFLDTLGKFGVTPVDPQGEKFNPERHEAVSMQEVEGAVPGTVITVMQKGYELNGRLVRPAMVIVAKEPGGA